MIVLFLILSCTFRNFNIKEKGIEEEAGRVTQSSDDGDSKAVLDEVNRDFALKKNKEGLFPIEEAIEAENIEMVSALLNLEDCNYPNKVYKRIIDKSSLRMFNLIPQKNLNYKLLLTIKENEDGELEREFLKRIELTELERLIIEGKSEEAREKSIKNEGVW